MPRHSIRDGWSSLYKSQLFQVPIHFHLQRRQFLFQLLQRPPNYHQINLFLFLEGIHITRNIQIEIILPNLVEAGKIGVLVQCFKVAKNNLLIIQRNILLHAQIDAVNY